MRGRGFRRASTTLDARPRRRIVSGRRHIPPRRQDTMSRRPWDSRGAPRPAPASWRGCPRRSRLSSLLLVQAWIDVVEEDAERCGDWDGDEHSEYPGPAEPGDQRNDDEDRRQTHSVAHDLR